MPGRLCVACIKEIHGLNLYSIEASGNYAGGTAVVAALSEKEACTLAGRIDGNFKSVRWNDPDEVSLVGPPGSFSGPLGVVCFYEWSE